MTAELLLDTHVWIWMVDGPDRLAPRLRRQLDRAERLWVSPFSAWELALLVERERLVLDVGVETWIDRSIRRARLDEAPFDRTVALRSRSIGLDHDDPADRFLAATAAVHDLTLVTADARLLAGTGYRSRAAR